MTAIGRNLEPVNTVPSGMANTGKEMSMVTATLATFRLRTELAATTGRNSNRNSSKECRVSSTYISNFSSRSPGGKRGTMRCGELRWLGLLLPLAFFWESSGRMVELWQHQHRGGVCVCFHVLGSTSSLPFLLSQPTWFSFNR